LHFGQFHFTADKLVINGWGTGQPLPIALALNGFTRNSKHVFQSCKWLNMTYVNLFQWSCNLHLYSSTLWSPTASSRKAFVFILTLEIDGMFLTICLFEKF